MMRLLTAAAGLSLLVSAPLAQAVETSRASAPVADASALAAGEEPLWIGFALAIGLIIYFIAEHDDDDDPDSP